MIATVFLCCGWSIGCAAQPVVSDTRQVEESAVRALVVARDKATLSAELASRIIALPVRPGLGFRKGDPLVRLACDRYTAQRDVAAADLKAAKKSLASIKKLVSLDSAGPLDLAIASAQAERAAAQLRLYQADVRRCSIKAPFAGRVVGWFANPHESVTPGSEVLEIYSDEGLELEMIVPSSWLEWIEPGITVNFKADGIGRSYVAQVSTPDVKVDPVSQTLKVRARFDVIPPNLIPGLSGSVTFSRP